MNYFAHAIRYLDRPYFMAGLAVPDWLSIIDRKIRVRRRSIERFLPSLEGVDRELALGVLQHLDDDQWFHGTAAFFEITGEFGRRFREVLEPREGWRCGFLGHLVLELLLDSTLIEDDRSALQLYYEVLGGLDGVRVQSVVSLLAGQEPADLDRLIGMFISERFLEDYLDDERLLFRLNQVMRRIGLEPLPCRFANSLSECRSIVRARLADLLPEERFGTI